MVWDQYDCTLVWTGITVTRIDLECAERGPRTSSLTDRHEMSNLDVDLCCRDCPH